MIIKEINQDINSTETYISEHEAKGALFISFKDAPDGYWIHENSIHEAIKDYMKDAKPFIFRQ